MAAAEEADAENDKDGGKKDAKKKLKKIYYNYPNMTKTLGPF